jgi:hypothetical protein
MEYRTNSLYSDLSTDLDTSSMIDLSKDKFDENDYSDTLNEILDCYNFKSDKSEFENCSYNFECDKSAFENCKLENKRMGKQLDHFSLPLFCRIYFRIINNSYNLTKRYKTFCLKQKYKKKISKNIFCSRLQTHTNLYEEFLDDTITIMYRFETWNNYNGIFGGYKCKDTGKAWIFFIHHNDINMFIDNISEDINDLYIKYLNKLSHSIIGSIYFIEKFTIKDKIENKTDLFHMVEKIKDSFYKRNVSL